MGRRRKPFQPLFLGEGNEQQQREEDEEKQEELEEEENNKEKWEKMEEDGDPESQHRPIVLGLASSATTMTEKFWCEDDELAILQGMIEYKAKRGIDPLSNCRYFRRFIRKSLHVDVNRTQIVTKIRNLKRKFQHAMRNKSKKMMMSNDPHGLKLLELSERIWESEIDDDNKKDVDVSGSVSRCKRELVMEDEGDLGVVKMGNATLEEKWKKHKVKETEVFMKRLELIREMTEKTLNAVKTLHS